MRGDGLTLCQGGGQGGVRNGLFSIELSAWAQAAQGVGDSPSLGLLQSCGDVAVGIMGWESERSFPTLMIL